MLKELNNINLHLYVLQMIKYNVDTSKIIGEDFNYQDIVGVINILKNHGKVSSLSGELKITDSGKEYYNELLKKLGVSSKGPVIMPQFQFFNRKIGKFEIYLKK